MPAFGNAWGYSQNLFKSLLPLQQKRAKNDETPGLRVLVFQLLIDVDGLLHGLHGVFVPLRGC